MDAGELRKIFSDPRGSHILDAFLSSSTVGEKSRYIVDPLGGYLPSSRGYLRGRGGIHVPTPGVPISWTHF